MPKMKEISDERKDKLQENAFRNKTPRSELKVRRPMSRVDGWVSIKKHLFE